MAVYLTFVSKWFFFVAFLQLVKKQTWMSLSFPTATIFDTAVYMFIPFIKFVPVKVIKGLMCIIQSASLHGNFMTFEWLKTFPGAANFDTIGHTSTFRSQSV
jgi:hypothetical protein